MYVIDASSFEWYPLAGVSLYLERPDQEHSRGPAFLRWTRISAELSFGLGSQRQYTPTEIFWSRDSATILLSVSGTVGSGTLQRRGRQEDKRLAQVRKCKLSR